MRKEINMMVCQKCKKGVLRENYDFDYSGEVILECSYCEYTFSVYENEINALCKKYIKNFMLTIGVLFAILAILLYIYNQKMIIEVAYLIGLTCLAFIISYFTKVN